MDATQPAGVDTGSSGDAPTPAPAVEDALPAGQRSLVDDLGALIDDGRTYAEAELAYQKTRLAFAADRGKGGAIFLLGALGFLHLALIGLVVGSIFALSPQLGPWLAMAAVVGLLLAGTAVFLWLARNRFGSVGEAFRETKP